MPGVKIREAKPEDAAIMYALVDSLLEEKNLYIVPEGLPRSVEEERAYLEYVTPEKHLVLLAILDNEVVGNTVCNIGPFDMNIHTADVGISVKKGHRGKGLGTKLMKATHRRLKKKKGVKKATISVFAPNKKGRRFYKNLGYVKEGKKKGQWLFKGDYIDEIIMAKWL